MPSEPIQQAPTTQTEATSQVHAGASEEAAQRARLDAEERLRLALEAAEIERKRFEEERAALASAL
ncbi:MAG: hypothetical protein ACMG6S_34375, partial [Byssovorax sp.]